MPGTAKKQQSRMLMRRSTPQPFIMKTEIGGKKRAKMRAISLVASPILDSAGWGSATKKLTLQNIKGINLNHAYSRPLNLLKCVEKSTITKNL